MSGGAWDAAKASYSGSLYRPRGMPLGQNNGAGFSVGAPVGTLRLTPLDGGSMRLEYVVDGVSGTKVVQRQSFGAPHPIPLTRVDDLWWAGISENGWGFALAQQHRNFFGVLYTYDASGEPTWFVMPSGQMQPPDNGVLTINETVYRTRGSPWVGAAYDPTRLVVTPAGNIRLTFSGGWERATLSGTIEGWRSINYLVTRQPF